MRDSCLVCDLDGDFCRDGCVVADVMPPELESMKSVGKCSGVKPIDKWRSGDASRADLGAIDH